MLPLGCVSWPSLFIPRQRPSEAWRNAVLKSGPRIIPEIELFRGAFPGSGAFQRRMADLVDELGENRPAFRDIEECDVSAARAGDGILTFENQTALAEELTLS